MDEVDGLGASDRSGLAEHIQLIKSSRAPIICICNDRQSQKMKSLLPYLTAWIFATAVLLEVARLEGMALSPKATVSPCFFN